MDLYSRLITTIGEFMKWSNKKIKFVRQSETAECGLACVNMIANYHGYNITLNELRQKFPISSRGMKLSKLIEISDELKIKARAVRLEHSDIKKLNLPCILHWDLNHFVVLANRSNKGITILDPARGELDIIYQELYDRFSGIAVEFYPVSDFLKRKEIKKTAIGTYLKEIQGFPKAATVLIVIAVALELITLINPMYLQIVTDRIVGAGDDALLVPLSIVFLLILSIQFALTICRYWLIINAGTQINTSWLNQLYSHIIRLPYSWFEVRSKADVISRFSSIRNIQSGLAVSILSSFMDGLVSIAAISILFIYNMWLGLIVILFFKAYLFYKYFFLPRLKTATSEVVLGQAAQQHEIIESLNALLAIKINDKTFYRENKFSGAVGGALNAEVTIQRLTTFASAVNQWFTLSMRITVIAYGTYLISAGVLTTGMLFTFILYAELFISRAFSFVDKWHDLKMLNFHFDRIQEVMCLEVEEPAQQPEHRYYSVKNYDLECRGLSFRYPGSDDWVFKDLSFEVKSGESVAIVGPSGCGKSTLAKAILGLLPPSEGFVLIDGMTPSSIGLKKFRSFFGTVMQEDRLLSGSVFDNISFFEPSASFTAVQAAAKSAGIDQEILRMPMGYYTHIGDMGSSLSGGQIQRVLLARALYRAPKILILDEATSHLDVDMEKIVSANIKSFQITRIIIAHRPETIKTADRVIRL